MISSKGHFDEYENVFEEKAEKIFDEIEDAMNYFAKEHDVSEDVARERIENNTNADWIVCPNKKVYLMNM